MIYAILAIICATGLGFGIQYEEHTWLIFPSGAGLVIFGIAAMASLAAQMACP